MFSARSHGLYITLYIYNQQRLSSTKVHILLLSALRIFRVSLSLWHNLRSRIEKCGDLNASCFTEIPHNRKRHAKVIQFLRPVSNNKTPPISGLGLNQAYRRHNVH